MYSYCCFSPLNAVDKRGIEKYIDVEKLVRGKYQDNLEFMQVGTVSGQ